MSIVIKKTDILPFLRELKKEGFLIYAPIDKNGETIFDILDDESEKKLKLTYSTTILPPQKIIFSSRQILFNFKNNKITISKERKKVIIFGVHLNDIHAFLLLDDIFKKPLQDDYYSNKRKNTFIIGINQPPTPNHFQRAMGLDIHRGYDLFFNEIKDGYLINIGTEQGKRLLTAGLHLFQKSDWEEDVAKPLLDPLLSKPQLLSQAVEKGKNSKLWSELAEICFGCGNCTYVCPLCYCYEVEDELEINLKNGCRIRRWDSCLSPDFAIIAGGINFRKTLAERLYNWYHHKFVRMFQEYGKPGCVGCGRCITYCPAGINLYKNLKRLVDEIK
jgi:sulfhydrogenase subunit beta (sulfur reductase)